MGGMAILGPPHNMPDCPLHVLTCRPPSTRGIWVRCISRYSFPTPYPYSHGTPYSPTTGVTRSRAGSDTIHRPCRIPMLMGVRPYRKPNVETRTRFFFIRDVREIYKTPRLIHCCSYEIKNLQHIFHTSDAKTMTQKQTRCACIQKRGERTRVQRNTTRTTTDR